MSNACDFSNSNEKASIQVQQKAASNKQDLNNQTSPAIKVDTFHNSLAQLIGGIDCSYFINTSALDSLFWSNYSEHVNKAFLKMKKNRLEPMSEWMNKTNIKKIQESDLLFYPFSGADFLHANYFFPDMSDYILLAKEKIGNVPDIKSMKGKEIKIYLNAVDQSLRDIYKRSYFITGNMINDTRKGSELKGLNPLFYWFIARTNHEIIKVVNVFVDSSSVLIEIPVNTIAPKNVVSGIKFVFRKKGGQKLKTMTYFNCDISNRGFLKRPEFKQYLNLIKPCNTFVKSASYLMHYETFNEIKALVLSKSNVVLEDDTGIPYRFFEPSAWNINLFGRYVMPVSDFSTNVFQEDLDKAYSEEDKFKGLLPFSLGYHWGTQNQNQMIYVKK